VPPLQRKTPRVRTRGGQKAPKLPKRAAALFPKRGQTYGTVPPEITGPNRNPKGFFANRERFVDLPGLC